MRRRNDLAVLAVLADRSPVAVRRDEVQALFWGERPEERARHSLRQVVLQLRRACGSALDVETASLRLAPDFVHSDARELTAAAKTGRCREAIDLWTGDFLIGCEDVGAEGFRGWLDVERERLRRLLAFCYDRAVAELEASDDLDRAAAYALGWAGHFPLEERPHLRFIEILCRIGRVVEAAVAQGTFIRRLRADMEEEPSEDWLATTERLLQRARTADMAGVRARAGNSGGAAVRITVPGQPTAIVDASLIAGSRAPPVVARRRLMPVLALAAVICAVVLVGVRKVMGRSGRPPALAVGKVSSALPPIPSGASARCSPSRSPASRVSI